MSKKIFSANELKKLEKNKYVKKVSAKGITYTDEFKNYVIAEKSKGIQSREIFENAGFDVEILGDIRIKAAMKRWQTAYKNSGVLGLRDTRKNNKDNALKRTLSGEELLAKKDLQILQLMGEIELLKKFNSQEGSVKNNKKLYSLIYKNISQIKTKYKLTIDYLCKTAGVSKSGYYNHLKIYQKQNKDLELKELILKAYDYKGFKKGSRSIKMVLENVYGIVFNRKRIQRIMRKFEIKCPIRKANPYRRMMKATREHTIVPNSLNRNFNQGVCGKVLLTDITYLHYGVSKVAYLSTIKDGSTTEIMSYVLSKSLKLDIALDTVKILVKKHRKILAKDAFIHSDQGVHYTSPKFQKLLKKLKLGQSMSRRGNCWDNAPQESFFGHLKDNVDSKSCQSFDELQSKIDEYMEYYNNHRFQQQLNKLTPVMYRNQLIA